MRVILRRAAERLAQERLAYRGLHLGHPDDELLGVMLAQRVDGDADDRRDRALRYAVLRKLLDLGDLNGRRPVREDMRVVVVIAAAAADHS